MSLIKKSDVKSNLSSTDTSVYPFGLTRSDNAEVADGKEPHTHDISISPSHPIAPEAVPNAQVGGSVGIPADTKDSGKGSW
jgi:hypothetical protein